ncbi:MAG: hypothetical protein NC299_16250 [Lachnospiraceae bacterium]|nr:hypothetical protein [Lachnospiraceae bacterium]
MKFTVLMSVLLMLCSGCSAPPSSGYGSSGYSSAYSSPRYSSSSTYEYSSTYEPSDYYDDYGYDDDWYEDDYSWLEDMTYADFAVLFRDEITSEAQNVTYQQLARSTNGMEGEFVKFKGEVIQVLEKYEDGYEFYVVMMNITYHGDEYFSYYSDTVMVCIIKDFIDVRPLVDDIITVWGVSSGLTSYQSILGDIRTEPCVVASKVQFNSSDYGYGYGY